MTMFWRETFNAIEAHQCQCYDGAEAHYELFLLG